MTQITIQQGFEHRLKTLILKVIHARETRAHTNHYGPKIYTTMQKYALLALWHRSGRRVERFLDELCETRWPSWLGLREIPSRSSLYAWRQEIPLAEIRQFNDELLRGEEPRVLAIDGTGMDATIRSKHYEDRIRAAPLRGPKLDILVDTETLLIHDWSLLLRPRNDAYVATSLLSRTPHHGVLILGDKGYDSERLYALAAEHGNRLWAPVRNKPGTKAPPTRIRGWHKRRSHDEGCAQPGRRSLVETSIRCLKANVRALRARLAHVRKREMGWHVIVHNLERQIALLLRILWMRHWLATQPA